MTTDVAVVSDAAAPRPLVTDEDLRAYERDGAVRLRCVLPPDHVEFIRHDVEPRRPSLARAAGT